MEERTSWHWTVAAIDAKGLATGPKMLLVALASHANAEGYCWPSLSRLCAMCGSSERGARGWLRELEADGLIETQAQTRADGGKTSNLYRLNWSALRCRQPAGGRAFRAKHHRQCDLLPPEHDTDADTKIELPIRTNQKERVAASAARSTRKNLPVGKEDFLSAWNALADSAGLCRALTLSEDRERAYKARVADPWWVANWRRGLEAIPLSPFLLGHKGDRKWKANVDWFLRPGTLPKLLENRYVDAPSPSRGLDVLFG